MNACSFTEATDWLGELNVGELRDRLGGAALAPHPASASAVAAAAAQATGAAFMVITSRQVGLVRRAGPLQARGLTNDGMRLSVLTEEILTYTGNGVQERARVCHCPS